VAMPRAEPLARCQRDYALGLSRRRGCNDTFGVDPTPPALHEIPGLSVAAGGAARPGGDAPCTGNNGIGFTWGPFPQNRLPMILLRCHLLVPQSAWVCTVRALLAQPTRWRGVRLTPSLKRGACGAQKVNHYTPSPWASSTRRSYLRPLTLPRAKTTRILVKYHARAGGKPTRAALGLSARLS
jgi:hypothetical protein